MRRRAVLHRRADQAVAAVDGEAGLEAVGPDVHREQRIAILLADLVPGELGLAEILVVGRIGADDVAGELAEVAHRHLLRGIRKSGRIGEIGLLQAELAGPGVHFLGERALVAGQALGQGDAGVVAGLHHGALDQVLDPGLAVDRQEHARRVGRRAAFAPRVLARHVFGIEGDVALLELVEHDLRRHQLGHAGGRRRRVGVFLEQDGAGRGIEQDDVGGGGFEIAGLAADEADVSRRRDGRDRAAEEAQRDEAAPQRGLPPALENSAQRHVDLRHLGLRHRPIPSRPRHPRRGGTCPPLPLTGGLRRNNPAHYRSAGPKTG